MTALARRDRPLSSRDVEDCLALFLGLVPDAETRLRWVNAPVGAVLTQVLGSAEFQQQVLTPLVLREPLPQERLSPAPSLKLADWAQRRLPLEPESAARVGAARDWVTLLEGLLADATLTGFDAQLKAAGIDRLFRERLAQQPRAALSRAVLGAIDAASVLEVRGWAVNLCAKEERLTLEFYADSAFLGATRCGDSRPDVRETLGGDGCCGFTFRIPGALRERFTGGRSLIALDAVSRERVGLPTTVHADVTQGLDALAATREELRELRGILERIEARLPTLARLASVPLEAYAEYWQRFYQPAADGLAAGRAAALALPFRPLISVVIPLWNTPPPLLDAAIASVRAQTYTHWELLLADDASADSDARRAVLARHADPRIRVLHGATHSGIAATTNRGLAAAGGEYVAFLDHDDTLAPEALYEVVRVLDGGRVGLVYSDEDRIEADGFGRVVHHTPFFKPDFDPELLRSLNYVCHFLVIRRDLVTAVGGLGAGVEGAQDHDLVLRVTERLTPAEICHVARILYHWRVTPHSVSRDLQRANELQATIVRVVQAHLGRLHVAAQAEQHADPHGAARPFATRIRWALPLPAPRVSIIIPTRDRLELLEPCVASIVRHVAAYPGDIELLIVDNDSVEPKTLEFLAELAAGHARVVPYRGEFNWSAINNAAARTASGDVLVFLNNDTVVLSPDWCMELAASALRPDVGAVGARLLYDDGTIQHAGVVLGVEGTAGHDSVGEAPERGGYFGRSHLQRGAAAVTGACLATRRAVFEQVGGFDEIHLPVAFNDIDYCLRLRAHGYRVVYNPFAVLYHFESKSRGYEISEAQRLRHRAESATLRARWGAILDADPFYNVHFERQARPFDRLVAPPAQLFAAR